MVYNNTEIKHLVNVDKGQNTARVLMSGVIGDTLSGEDFAQSLLMMSSMGFDEVDIHINSMGGSIIQGLSIINAMNILRLNNTRVRTTLVGIADSMAGIVLAFGDRGKRTAASFSSGVIHEPLIKKASGELVPLEEVTDVELKKEMESMRSMLIDSLSGSTGKDKKELLALMKLNKRHNAKDLKKYGLIDSIFKVSNDLDIENKTAVQLMAACSNIVSNNQNNSKIKKSMELVNKTLGLQAEAKEQSAVESIKALQNQADVFKEKYNAEKEKVNELVNEKEELQAKLDEVEKSRVESFVDAQIEKGVFSKEKKEALVNSATSDFEAFKVLCESLNGQFVDVTEKLTTTKGSGKAKKEEMLNLAKEYHEADQNEALQDFKNEVGEKKFQEVEDFYIDNINLVTE